MTAAALNPIDRLVGWFSPQAGLRRARARVALSLARGYEGAKRGRRTGGWEAGGASANAEISPALHRLRARSRELLRNNPYAVKAVASLVSNAIGTGISVKLSEGQAVWEQWVRECDAAGHQDFYGLQALVCQTMHESGECLVRLRARRPDDGLVVPLQLEVLEPDYLDDLKTEQLAGGGYIINGVEFNAIGKCVAYWLYAQHPGEIMPLARTLQSHRVPASEILHLFEKKRPGQVRGVPRLTPSLLAFRDTDDYEEAELLRKGIESCFAAIVTTDDETAVLGQASSDGAGKRIEELSAGMIHYVRNGENIAFGHPASMGGYHEFIRACHHKLAAGVGTTYEQLTGDLSQVNYSSIRAGLVEYRRSIEQFQWLVFIPQLCEPVVAAFLQAAARAGKVKRGVTTEWTTPKWDWVDPVKDVAGELLEVAAGLKPWQEAVRRRGFDPETNLQQIAEDQAAFEKAGISIQIAKLALGAAAATAEPAKGKTDD